jgi:Ca-activated chloride channel homolog
MRSKIVGILAVLTFLVFLCPTTRAQTAVAPAVKVETVRMSLIVTDESDHQVNISRPEEVQVEEDGKPCKIKDVQLDMRPVVYALALDASGSFKSSFGKSLHLAKAFIENNGPKDETMLIRFVSSDLIETVQTFTADKTKLLDGLKAYIIEGGQTALIDAVYLTLEATAKYRADDQEIRRAVVVFSDGEDRASYYSLDALTKLLRQTDVQVFILGIVAQLDKEGSTLRKSPREKAEALLRRIAEESGGRVFFPKNNDELAAAAQEINKSLSSQFSVVFDRDVKPEEKGFRKVKISVAPSPQAEKRVAVTRPGYYVGPRELPKQEPPPKKKKN